MTGGGELSQGDVPPWLQYWDLVLLPRNSLIIRFTPSIWRHWLFLWENIPIFILLLQSSMQSWRLCYHQRKVNLPHNPSLFTPLYPAPAPGPFSWFSVKGKDAVIQYVFPSRCLGLVSNFRFLLSGGWGKRSPVYPSRSQQCFPFSKLPVWSLLHFIIPFTLFRCCGELYLFLFVFIFVCSIQ